MAKSIPLGIGVSMKLSDPFLVELDKGNYFIVQAESMYNEHGDIIWYQEKVIDHTPSKEEVFLLKLKGADKYETKVDWGNLYSHSQSVYNPPNHLEFNPGTGLGSYWSREGN